MGWNSVFSIPEDGNKKHGVWYLQQINASPTSFTVVAEKRSIQIVDESNRDTIRVTVDLATAKMAMKLQHEESPTYDSLILEHFTSKWPSFMQLVNFTEETKLGARGFTAQFWIQCTNA